MTVTTTADPFPGRCMFCAGLGSFGQVREGVTGAGGGFASNCAIDGGGGVAIGVASCAVGFGAVAAIVAKGTAVVAEGNGGAETSVGFELHPQTHAVNAKTTTISSMITLVRTLAGVHRKHPVLRPKAKTK